MHNINRDRIGGIGSQDGSAEAAEASAMAQTIDLNHATWQQLSAIEGIDEQQARAIVEYRTFHGHFLSWEDLSPVPGMDHERLTQVQHSARIGSTETAPT